MTSTPKTTPTKAVPTVSVVMPVWNRAHRIGQAIESVLSQTFQDIELIIVDDGSTDDVKTVVGGYDDIRLRLLQTPHRGVASARNTAIKAANGSYIAYLDSDNTWRPRFLEVLVKVLDSDEMGRAVAYAIAEVHECNGHVHPAGAKQAGEPFRLREMLHHNLIDQNTVVHARRCLAAIPGYDESLRRLVDWDFLAALTSRFEPIFVPEILVDYHWGLEENAISLREDLVSASLCVRKKLGPVPRASFRHDMVDYTWDHLPDEKYDNWFRMRQGPYDHSTYRPNGYPFVLQIEPTSRCNLKCPLCPVGRDELKRPQRDMSIGEFKGIVEDLRRWLMLLVLWDWGEPFANPDLPEIIRCASDHDIRTVTSTNAHYLQDDEYVAAILTSGLSTLIVAIDSIHDAQYEAYRVGGRLGRAIEGLRKTVELKRRTGSRTMINFRMVAMRHNEREVAKLRQLAREIGADRFTIKTLNPSCGSLSMDAELVPLDSKLRRFDYRGKTWDRIPVKAPCDRVMFMSNIFSNGDVVPCCYDFDSSMRIGNAFEVPFSRIWMSDDYAQVRRRIHEQREEIARCRNCHINFQLSKAGWFAEATDLAVPSRPFWDPRRYLQRTP